MAIKFLSKKSILEAMSRTSSNKEAARYLGVEFFTYRKWAQRYKEEFGLSLYDIHANASCRGVAKSSVNMDKVKAIKVVLETGKGGEYFTADEIKKEIINEGLMEEKCNRCGFAEKRMTDYKAPLLMNFKDSNKKNFTLDNLELICYNCYFLYVADPINEVQKRAIEIIDDPDNEFNWDVDDDKCESESIDDLEDYNEDCDFGDYGSFENDENYEPGNEFVAYINK